MFPISAEVNQEQFELGKQKAKVCMTCHGVDGISTQDPYPNLRGQKMGYLISSLKDYQTRERTSGIAILIQQQADTLSDQDIRDISYFYSMLGNTSSQVSDSSPVSDSNTGSDLKL
nr:cytochrome c [uncultured Vibrio sp.]